MNERTRSHRVPRLRRNVVLVSCLTVGVILLGTAFVVLGPSPNKRVDVSAPGTTDSPSPGSTPSAGEPSVQPSGNSKFGASPTPATRPTQQPPGPPPSTTGFPGPGNTGPRGTALTAYTGSCTITAANTVIEAKIIKCVVDVKAKGVKIKKSKIIGGVSSTGTASLTVEDSEIDAGTRFAAASGEANLTILRSNVHGGETSVNCVFNCHIQDSWLHGQYVPPDGNWHLDAFLSNGGNHITLKHNTIACDSPTTPNDGGCTADAAIFGDFAPNNYYTFDNNLFVASPNLAYCLYGGSQSNKKYGLQTDHIVVINNVFQKGPNGKCGAFGPITYFDSARPGNRWENNVWDDGKPLGPAY